MKACINFTEKNKSTSAFSIFYVSEGVPYFAAKKSNTSRIVTIVLVAVVAAVVVAVACIILLYRRLKKGVPGKTTLRS